MKTQYFTRASIAKGAAALLILPFQMLPVAKGSTQPQDIEVADIARLCVRVNKIGATGIGKVIGTEGETRYEIDGSELKVYLAPVDRLGEMTVVVDGNYGEIKLHEAIFVDVKNDAESEVEVSPYIFSAIAAGGGADYQTDIYMDGSGRVIVERLEDGSTVILDSHENPILRRSSDGTTTYYDAYQSARLLMSEHGDVSLNYNDAGTVKTMQLAEAVLARTTKHLITYNGTNIKEGDTIMTHAALYEMMMSTPAFVVLVYNDHAYHPNLVTASQIAFTCSYFSTNDEIVVERVNITSANVITTSIGKTSAGGLSLNSYKGLAFGSNSTANAEHAFSHGSSCKATQSCSHAEGSSSTASAVNAHAEGSGCGARGKSSHAEGLSCSAYGEGSHAEGLSTLADAYCSHAEGSGTKASGQYSHAQGISNNSDDADTQGAFSHGCGTYVQQKNAFLISGSQVYMLGVGGYDGTNHKSQGVMSVQQVLAAMLNPEAMTLGMDDDDAPRPTYKDKDVHEWTAKDLADYDRDLLAEWAEEEAKRKADAEE